MYINTILNIAGFVYLTLWTEDKNVNGKTFFSSIFFTPCSHKHFILQTLAACLWPKHHNSCCVFVQLEAFFKCTKPDLSV